MGKRKKTYTPAPHVDRAMSERLGVILEVVSGKTTVSEGARMLKLSRNHFQTILHRGLEGLADSIAPKASGRPAKTPEVVALEAQLERLRKENARLQERVGTTDRLLQAASGLLQGRIRPARQARTKRSASASGDDKADPDPERRRRDRLEAIDEMRRLGMSASLAASIAGVHDSTVRRWRASGRDHARRCTRGIDGRMCVPVEIKRRADEHVRALKGLVGAESLRRSVAGLSRRQAARLKAETLTAMERERKGALTRVGVTLPGVIRGMDGMHFRGAGGDAHALIAADASVPYRTTVKVGRHYNATFVAEMLAADLEANGAPLVYRLDRAKAHDVAEVRALLEHHGVLLLHGPPHCPRFYGQLERQNREHRAWEDDLALLSVEAMQPCLDEMLAAVNNLWRRRTLGWQTASQVWAARPRLDVDRQQLRAEVKQRAAHIGRELQRRGKPADLAERLAIEQALATRGYLRQSTGGWC
jgi:transposase